MLEKVFKIGDKFVRTVKKEYAPGIIGPFSLQSVITKDLELIVYDVLEETEFTEKDSNEHLRKIVEFLE